MPISIPAFVQYQSPIVPLRGLWNHAPPEGDQFVNCEIDWLVSPPGSAVAFSLSGNSPVAISQIVAISVDNTRCGADLAFIFPDSGFILDISAGSDGIYPVFTNALTFYVSGASGPGVAIGDRTVFQILNSMPPPVPLPIGAHQTVNSLGGANIAVNGSNVIAGSPTSGTLKGITGSVVAIGGAATGAVILVMQDGAGAILWASSFGAGASQVANVPISVTGLNRRFSNGINLVVSGSTLGPGSVATLNVYFTQP